ncbi:hypothetical protein B0H66DRAFT_520208 [Apodospora peruviana]|uniref:Glycoside hydrolase family 125 protein n=1 Tax=Apodospora peruviana TaxID=516989 RepID=A0AAE0M3Y1_9PEZI|nr:hypothetical protein B0H66DRAFT_520208 [Apodospora peruviana]
MKILALTFLLLFAQVQSQSSCPDYSEYSKARHPPYSSGTYALPYQRLPPACRTFNSTIIEEVINSMSTLIHDPDLYRLFENTLPNTLDTAIRWRGVAANNSAEELTFIITGDINAMWLRDSANQLQSYHVFLPTSPDTTTDSLSSLFRGVINLQARYLLTSPFCNSFQPPPESGIPPATNGASASDTVFPPYDLQKVFECKYELDSLAAFLQISTTYASITHDTAFFTKFQWVHAVRAALSTAKAMMTPTYDANGAVLNSPYTFTRLTTRTTETLANDGLGHPVARDIGLIRSAFRPSDDSTTFQFLIPANMMFAHYLQPTSDILFAINETVLGQEIRDFGTSLRDAITTHGIVSVPSAKDGNETETIYAYEVDGFGSSLIMDDANVPSLLSAPLLGYTNPSDPVYLRTRNRILDSDSGNGNPYFMRGPVINAVGGPHAGPGMAWPMASIVRILTSQDDDEISKTLKEILASTCGLGLIHESVNAFNASRWTRQWFSWANGLFGQMIYDIKDRNPGILAQSFQ